MGNLAYNEAWKQIYLRHLARGVQPVIAATLTNVGQDRIQEAFKRDPEFKHAVALTIMNAPPPVKW